MKVIGTFECMLSNQRRCKVQKKLSQMMLTLMTLLLWISPGLGDDKPPDCKAQDPAFCSSPCFYLRERGYGNKECIMDLCSYLYPQLSLRDLERSWYLPLICKDELRYRSKRGILNKNIAYLLLKLHPFLNQTSQFGFLTSGRFRRISGSFGTEFLGKRSNNNKPISGGSNQNPYRTKPTPGFYSVPLNKFAESKILKRDEDVQQELIDSQKKRLSIRGNEKIILGSEFLGKRIFHQNEMIRRLSGTEFLGKRNENLFDASEFLGKRIPNSFTGDDVPGKDQNEPASGTELLGKKAVKSPVLSSRLKDFELNFFGRDSLKKSSRNLKPGRRLVCLKNTLN